MARTIIMTQTTNQKQLHSSTSKRLWFGWEAASWNPSVIMACNLAMFDLNIWFSSRKLATSWLNSRIRLNDSRTRCDLLPHSLNFISKSVPLWRLIVCFTHPVLCLAASALSIRACILSSYWVILRPQTVRIAPNIWSIYLIWGTSPWKQYGGFRENRRSSHRLTNAVPVGDTPKVHTYTYLPPPRWIEKIGRPMLGCNV